MDGIIVFAIGWVCGGVFIVALISIFILDTLKDILKELKQRF